MAEILGTYMINETDVLPSQSGSAILAIFCEPGTNKKVYIQNVDIQNFRRDAIGTSSQTVTDYEIQRITAQTAGVELTPIKLDSDASNIPSQIKFFKNGNPTYSNISLTISTTSTLTFAIGPPGTITRASGSWLTDGVIPGASISFTGTTSNNNTFVVRTVTATVVTVWTQQPVVNESAGAATTTATVPNVLGRVAARHNFFATTANAKFNSFNIGNKEVCFGSLSNFHLNKGGTIERITLAEGEGFSLKMVHTQDTDNATMTKEFHTFLIECMFTLDWGPNKTYKVSDYCSPNGENSSIFSIMNNSGSGRVVEIFDIVISEIGDTSTPYFMVVPFDYIEPQAINDPARDVGYIKIDSNYPNIDSYVTIKKDVTLFPKGFSSGNPLFPLSFGSSVPANGLNYLITKDFLGPVYAAWFAEKTELTANPTATVTNHLVSLAQRDSSILVSNDLYIRPGEGIAIVAAAEPLTGVAAATANQVNKFSMGKFGYSITFRVEEDILPILTLTGLISNSEVRIYTHNTTTERAGIESSGTSFSWQYVYAASDYVDIIIIHLDYQYLRLDNVLLLATDTTIPVQQTIDRVYSNPV